MFKQLPEISWMRSKELNKLNKWPSERNLRKMIADGMGEKWVIIRNDGTELYRPRVWKSERVRSSDLEAIFISACEKSLESRKAGKHDLGILQPWSLWEAPPFNDNFVKVGFIQRCFLDKISRVARTLPYKLVPHRSAKKGVASQFSRRV